MAIAPESGATEAPELTQFREDDFAEFGDNFDQDAPDDEAPDGDPEPAPADAGPPSETPDAQPRDERGRFAPKDGAAETPPAPATGDAPPTAGAVDAQPGTQPPASPEGAPPAPDTPSEFTWNAAREEYRFPGSRVTADGILIPREHEGTLRQMLAEGVEHRTTFRQRLGDMQRQVEAARRELETHPDVVAGKVVFAALEALAQGGDDAIAEWVMEPQKVLADLKAKAERAALEAKVSLYEQGGPAAGVAAAQASGEAPAAPAIDPVALRAELPRVLGDLVAQVPEFKGLTSDDVTRISARLGEDFLDRCFVMVDPSGPALYDAQGGLIGQPGEVLVDFAFLRKQLRYEAERSAAVSRQAAAAAKALEANARRGGGTAPANPTPPAVPVGGGEGGAKKAPLLPKLGDRASLDRWMELSLDEQQASREQGIREE